MIDVPTTIDGVFTTTNYDTGETQERKQVTAGRGRVCSATQSQ